MSDLELRGQHYLFAHTILRSRFLGNPEAVMNQLKEGGVTLLRSLWDRAGFDPSIKEMVREHFEPGAPKHHLVEPDGLECQLEKLPDGTTIALVTMPVPRAMPEAYFLAAVQGPALSRYITLEYTTAHPLGAVLCEWDGDDHVNMGKGLEPKLAAFREAVIGLLDRSEKETRPGAGSPRVPARGEQAVSDSGANNSSRPDRGEAGRRADLLRGAEEGEKRNMKCPKCKTDWPSRAKFCGKCGTEFAEETPGGTPSAVEERDSELTMPAGVLTPIEGRGPGQSASRGFSEQMTALADRAGLKVKSVADGVVGTVFPLKEGRTQIVVFKYAGELAGKPIVRINSPVADLKKNPINGEAAIGLLNAAGKVKIGGFSIDGNHLVVHQGMILSELTPEELRDVALALAVFADDAEKNLTGGDAF